MYNIIRFMNGKKSKIFGATVLLITLSVTNPACEKCQEQIDDHPSTPEAPTTVGEKLGPRVDEAPITSTATGVSSGTFSITPTTTPPVI